MKKAKILLSAAGILSVIAGSLAFKAQHKFTGRYFCTAIKSSTARFTMNYTTSAAGTTTLFCSTVANVSKTIPFRLIPLS
jgi:hypothetical protein